MLTAAAFSAGAFADEIRLWADEMTVADDGVALRGEAEVKLRGTSVLAQEIIYARDDDRLTAADGVTLYTVHSRGDAPEDFGMTIITADTLDMRLTDNIGTARNINLRAQHDWIHPELQRRFPKLILRATADTMDFTRTTRDFTDVALTTCVHPDDDYADGNVDIADRDVVLRAAHMHLDHAAGIGRAKSMRVHFKGVPIFYFPAATFPLNDQRKTGFLFPAVGYDGDLGAVLEAPYYLNLASQYDATVTPRLLSKRGAQVHGELRFLNAGGDGALRGEWLPADRQRDGRERYTWHYRQRYDFNSNWRARLNWRRWSDDGYVNDFGGVAQVADRYARQDASMSFYGDTVTFSARVRGHQRDGNDNGDDPHEMLPQLRMKLQPANIGFLRLAADAEYVDFQNGVTLDSDGNNTAMDGTRLTITPSLSLPFANSFSSLALRAALQSINYDLNDDPSAPSLSANIPIYRVDGKLFFERPLTTRGENFLQTLEPRLLYVSIPNRAQNNFPMFDTGDGDENNFAHFFRDNRFTGGDRVGDTEQLALGITSRILDRHGQQQMQLNLGQVFYLRDRHMLDGNVDDRATSGVFGEVTAATDHWTATAFAKQNATHLTATYTDRHTVSGSYRHARDQDDVNQLTLNLQTPLAERWQLQTGGTYAFTGESNTRTANFGIGYNGCCWSIKLSAQRYLVGKDETKNRVSVTFALNELGALAM